MLDVTPGGENYFNILQDKEYYVPFIKKHIDRFTYGTDMYNTFYDNHNLQTSFMAKLIQDGIYKFINLEYGENAGSYAVRISFKNDITKEDIEFMIGLFALLGYTETLHNDDF